MNFLITFLEGIITFISPCVLPLLPVYILYFAGGDNAGEDKKKSPRAFLNALGFVLGFTAVFVTLGIFASALSSLLRQWQTALNIVTGAVVAGFGLYYTGLLKLPFLGRTVKPEAGFRPKNPALSFLFGIVFAIGWSPCTGAFLGSAMMMASQQSEWLYGLLLLLTYSAGLGLPFLLCAVFIESLKGAFAFIKRHYAVINVVCGIFLIIIGVLMMTGLFAAMVL